MTREMVGKLFVLFLVLSFLFPFQSRADKRVELNLGMDSPVGDLNEYWRVGFGINGTFMAELTPFTSIGVSAGYGKLGLDEDYLLDAIEAPEDFTIDGGDFSAINLCVELRANTGGMDKADFFAGIGGGLYIVNLSRIEDDEGDLVTTPFDWENKLGGYVNAGMGYPVSDTVRLGVKLKYTMFSAGSDTGFLDLENTRSYFSLQGMVAIGL